VYETRAYGVGPQVLKILAPYMYPGDLYSQCPICMAFYYISFVLLYGFIQQKKTYEEDLATPILCTEREKGGGRWIFYTIRRQRMGDCHP